jgi:hypothetical protein
MQPSINIPSWSASENAGPQFTKAKAWLHKDPAAAARHPPTLCNAG